MGIAARSTEEARESGKEGGRDGGRNGWAMDQRNILFGTHVFVELVDIGGGREAC